MSVVLLILKITGCVLLTIFLLILLLVLAALFVPVRYVVSVKSEEETQADLRFYWLLYLVCFRMKMADGEKEASFRVLGIRLFSTAAPKRKKKFKEETDNWKDSYEEMKDEPALAALEIHEEQQSDEDLAEDIVKKEKNVNEKATDDFVKKIKFSKIRRIYKFFRSIPEKIKGAGKKLSAIYRIIIDEKNQMSIKLLLKELRYLLRHYRPRKITADFCYCMGDPAYTGKLLAVLSMIPFLYQKKVQIVPDFESEQFYVRGILHAKGRIRSVHLIRSGLHIWRDRNLKKLIRKVRQ